MLAPLSPSRAEVLGALFGRLNEALALTDDVAGHLPVMDDEELLQVRDYAEQLGKHAWRLVCECDAALIARTESRQGAHDVNGEGRKAAVAALAADAGVSSRMIYLNAAIHTTFLAPDEHRANDYTIPNLDKSFFTVALGAGTDRDARRAALEHFAECRALNASYSTRDARAYVERQRAAEILTGDPQSELAEVGPRYLLQPRVSEGCFVTLSQQAARAGQGIDRWAASVLEASMQKKDG